MYVSTGIEEGCTDIAQTVILCKGMVENTDAKSVYLGMHFTDTYVWKDVVETEILCIKYIYRSMTVF